MSDAAPVVWLDEGGGREEAARALHGWARARGIRLTVPNEQATSVVVDVTLGDAVEKELERARLAIGAADGDTADRALARAEALLREHPELPQAPWLRAEVERAWSVRWSRLEPRDEARARVAWENAHALDGGRAAGVGETAYPPRRPVPTRIVFAKSARLEVRLDGVPLSETPGAAGHAEYRADVVPGEHQLVAMVDGRVVFASWLAVASATSENVARFGVADDACSRMQLGQVHLTAEDAPSGDAKVDATGVTCPRWIAAVPGPKAGSVRVATCEHDTCTPLLEWRTERLPPPGAAPDRRPKAGLPTWATWTLVGIGAATAASVAAIAAGAFEPRPVEPRFVIGGARQE